MIKLKDSYLNLIILMLVNIIAGLYMIISPETVSYWVIRCIGVVWFIEGVFYATKVVNKYK